MVLRQSWESLIERKRFEQRREPKRGEKVTIMLTTVVNYIKQEVQDRNVSNSTMEAIMGMSHRTVRSRNKFSTTEEDILFSIQCLASETMIRFIVLYEIIL